ncbi:MAG TPA: MDR family MFS transporter [Herpetosiphonaceae bacterium]
MHVETASTAAAGPRSAPISKSHHALILTLLVATFVVILNETIMNVALVRLSEYFVVEKTTVQWLATAFMLVMAVVIPTTGFLIQRFTTRALFLSAMGIFTLGTLTAAASPTFGVLLASRVLQAAGTAIMLPLLMTVILALVPMDRRGAMMGTASIVISVAPAIGPTISGLILQVLSWRFLFLFVVPIAAAVLWYGWRNLINVGERQTASLDLWSVACSAIGFGGLVYGFSSAGEGAGWTSPLVYGPLAAGAAGLVAFVWRQGRLAAPVLDLRAFRFPMFTLSVVMMMGVMVALLGAGILLPLYFQELRKLSPLQTGLFLLPGGALLGVAGPKIGRIFDRSGPRALVLGGSALVLVTLAIFSQIGAATPILLLLAVHAVFSMGLAMLFTPVMTTGLNQLPPELHSHGSAISSTMQQVAGAVGTALLITLMSTRAQQVAQAGAGAEAAQIAGLRFAFLAAAVLALLSLAGGLFMRRVEADHEPAGAPAAIGAAE